MGWRISRLAASSWLSLGVFLWVLLILPAGDAVGASSQLRGCGSTAHARHIEAREIGCRTARRVAESAQRTGRTTAGWRCRRRARPRTTAECRRGAELVRWSGRPTPRRHHRSLAPAAPGTTSGSACSQGLPPQSAVSLPADDAAHTQPHEWWYFVGHFVTEDGRRMGFELTFFSFRDRLNQRIDAAVTDDQSHAFQFLSGSAAGNPAQVANGFNLEGAGQAAKGGAGHDALHIAVGQYVLDLGLDSTKAPVAQFHDGYFDASDLGLPVPAALYSWYYSRERMATSGTLRIGDRTLRVRGSSWFDHQWGNLYLEGLVLAGFRYDWFGIQLDDSRELMLLRIHFGDQVVGVYGSLVDGLCHTTEIPTSELSMRPTGSWARSDAAWTCSYPMGWDIRAGDMNLHVAPTLPDQEIRSTSSGHFPIYWEGEATITGTDQSGPDGRTTNLKGNAYNEMVGYCTT
jgi:predicted secreted hydrolase